MSDNNPDWRMVYATPHPRHPRRKSSPRKKRTEPGLFNRYRIRPPPREEQEHEFIAEMEQIGRHDIANDDPDGFNIAFDRWLKARQRRGRKDSENR